MSDNQVPEPLSAEELESKLWLVGASPHSNTAKLLKSHDRLFRAQVAAKDLRIAELEAQNKRLFDQTVMLSMSEIHPNIRWASKQMWMFVMGRECSAATVAEITSKIGVKHAIEQERDRLLEQHESILSALPPDSPCKNLDTGRSVADDVADLVQEKARLEVDLGDEMNLRRQESKQLAASESARANAEQKAKQYLLRVGELAIERDAERAARKKAEEKGIAAMDDREHFREERDALRTGLEKILNHLSVLDGFHLLTHREDSMEVCYDWCPLCHLKDALAAARALLQPENPITQQAQTLAPAEREGTTKHNEDPALPKNQCKCCGAPCDEDGWCDVVIPNEIWNRAFPDEGMVCFRCITRRLNEMGEKDVPLIWVAGPYADIEQERNSLLTKLESALLQPENPATDTAVDLDALTGTADDTIPRPTVEAIEAHLKTTVPMTVKERVQR